MFYISFNYIIILIGRKFYYNWQHLILIDIFLLPTDHLDQNDDAKQALPQHRHVKVPRQRNERRPTPPNLPTHRQACWSHLRATTP